MIRAIFRDGVIYPEEPVPQEWSDGEQVQVAGTTASLKQEFEHLSAQWKADTRFSSSTTEMATHPAYQRIIGMGFEIVPLILNDLQKGPHWWFWALRAITGDDPVPASSRGKIEEMARAWIAWGNQHHLIPANAPGK